MSVITLLNDDKEVISLLLIATGEGPFVSDTDENYIPDTGIVSGMEYPCIMSGVPKHPDMLDTPLYNFALAHHNGGLHTICVSGQPMTLQVDLKDGWKLCLSMEDDRRGRWTAQHPDESQLSGQCAITDEDRSKSCTQESKNVHTE